MQPSERSGFIPELEATRGLAALMVAGFHASQTSILATEPVWKGQLLTQMRESASTVESMLAHVIRPLFDGQAAVVYFFVLSGFVLASSLERDSRPVPALSWRFLLRRLFRIYPAVIGTILLFVLVFHTTGLNIDGPAPYSLERVVANMLLIENSIDGVTWTMQTELLAIPVILIGFLLWRKIHRAWLFALATLFTLLSYSSDWNFLLGSVSRTAPLCAFVYGMIVYAIGHRAIRRVPPRIHGLVAAVAVLVLLTTSSVIGHRHQLLVQTTAASFLVTYIAYGQSRTISGLLNRAPVRFLGRVSYSFYLLHPLTLTVIWHRPQLWSPFLDAGVPRIALLVGLVVGTVAAVLPVAYLCHRFVELPGIELGRRVAARLENRRSVVPEARPEPAALLQQTSRVE